MLATRTMHFVGVTRLSGGFAVGTPSRNQRGRLLSAAAGFILTFGLAFQATGAELDGLDRDAQSYATQFGISQAEARTRLLNQTLVGDLDSQLSAAGFSWFAGLAIEHAPAWQIVVYSTAESPIGLNDIVRASPMADRVVVRQVKYSLASLEAMQMGLAHSASQAHHWSYIDVRTNRIQVHVGDPSDWELLSRQLTVALPWDAVEVVSDGRVVHAAALVYGGLDLNNNVGTLQCTSGFAVSEDGTTSKGVVTAAHCPNTLYYSSVSLPFDHQNVGGSHDEQFNRKATFTVDNLIRTQQSGSTRSITGIRGRANQSVGDYVCKYGHSGYACGFIESKNALPDPEEVPNGASTYILVEPAIGDGTSDDLSDHGDSGGPVFIGNLALGIIHGCITQGLDCSQPLFNDKLVYTAINYVEGGLGVSVLLQ